MSVASNKFVMPGRHGIAAPFQNISTNDHRPWNEAIPALLFIATNIYHQSAGIESPQAMIRCEKELGYRPVQILKRTSRFDLEARLLIESLQLDAIEPLDP